MATATTKDLDGDEPPTAEFFSSNKLVPTIKAYDNDEFLSGQTARPIRVLCEYQYPKDQLAAHKIFNTILFMGSSKALSPDAHESIRKTLESALDCARSRGGDEARIRQAEEDLEKCEKTAWLSPLYVKAKELARRLAEWGIGRGGNSDIAKHYICTGGGPGFMAAANHGASLVPGAKTVGMSVSQPKPFQSGKYYDIASGRVGIGGAATAPHPPDSDSAKLEPSRFVIKAARQSTRSKALARLRNPHVSQELSFEFHYFFTRKFWMMMPARALVVMPGGLGTCDELFESITLMQCGKTSSIPVVLMGKDYWKTVINWDLLVERGTVSPRDRDRLFFTDSVDEAFEHITEVIERNEKARIEVLERAVGAIAASETKQAPFQDE
jgi:uncharacterized protein (TIGR00730 family)